MKKGIFLGFNLLSVSVFLVSSTLAQDSPQWHLPKGAKARLGKGRISNIAYSPDGNYLAVAASTGIPIYRGVHWFISRLVDSFFLYSTLRIHISPRWGFRVLVYLCTIDMSPRWG